jgi:hypothetical protein
MDDGELAWSHCREQLHIQSLKLSGWSRYKQVRLQKFSEADNLVTEML